jgi:hypothetical protein
MDGEGLDVFFSDLAQRQGLAQSNWEQNQRYRESIRASLFPQQLNVLNDPSRRKSALCPRRAGKSWTAMSYAFDECLAHDRAKVVIVTLTLKSAKNIYWNEIKDFARKFGVSIEMYVNDMRIDFANGSQIIMIGAESMAQIEKLRGGKYHLVIIDEAKSYPPLVLKELITDVVRPALLDYRGTLLMIGTPGNILSGPFFESTFPGCKVEGSNDDGKLYSRDYYDHEPYWRNNPEKRPMWSRHHWTLQDNVTQPHQWEDALMDKEDSGWSDDHPSWQREYLGRWVASESAYVYSYANLLHTKPEAVVWEPDYVNGNQFGLPLDQEWHYLLGLDLGWEDDFAAVLGAYNPHDGVLYHVWEYKDNHQDVDQVARHIHSAIELAGGQIDKIVADAGGLGKMVVETLNRRYGLNIEAAEKKEKNDFIELLNTDYHSGRVKILTHSDLSREAQALQWDLGESSKKHLARTGKLREHRNLPNHLCDAWLYIWRFSYHFWQEERISLAEPGTIEYEDMVMRQSVERLVSERKEKLGSTFWDELRQDSIDPLKGNPWN